MDIINPREPEEEKKRDPGPWQGIGCFWVFCGIAILVIVVFIAPEVANWISRQ